MGRFLTWVARSKWTARYPNTTAALLVTAIAGIAFGIGLVIDVTLPNWVAYIILGGFFLLMFARGIRDDRRDR